MAQFIRFQKVRLFLSQSTCFYYVQTGYYSFTPRLHSELQRSWLFTSSYPLRLQAIFIPLLFLPVPVLRSLLKNTL